MDLFSPSAYGLSTADPRGAGATMAPRPEPGIARSAVNRDLHVLHPDNPLVWFGALLAATAGLIGVATSARVRIGPAAAGGNVSLGRS